MTPSTWRWLRSFQARSMGASIAVCLLVWAGWSAWTFWEAGRSRSAMFDEGLRYTARLIVKSFPKTLVDQGVSSNFDLADGNNDPLEELNFQVWTHDRRLIGRTATTPEQPLNPAFTPGFSSTQIAGRTWRVYSQSDADSSIQVQVAENIEQRRSFAAMAAQLGLVNVLVLALPMVLGLWAAGLWTARPLLRLRNSVQQRSPTDTTALSADGLPQEVVPLVQAFNHMLVRATQAREAQQRFVADAAHELRTPLAALRVQAQVALRMRDEDERDAALQRLVQGIDRSTRVAEQLLELARVESLQADSDAVPLGATQLRQVVWEAIESTRRLAARRGVQVRCEVGDITVQSHHTLLSIALRNLLDNAIRYTDAGSEVQLLCQLRDGVLRLLVLDQGPGIAPAEQASAMQAFVRLGGGDEGGSGLGLSIVQRVCSLLRIRLKLAPRDGAPGLMVSLELRVVAAGSTPDRVGLLGK